jgi:hypothetical protein
MVTATRIISIDGTTEKIFLQLVEGGQRAPPFPKFGNFLWFF